MNDWRLDRDHAKYNKFCNRKRLPIHTDRQTSSIDSENTIPEVQGGCLTNNTNDAKESKQLHLFIGIPYVMELWNLFSESPVILFLLR